jgi:hypothetical protein
MAPIGLVGCMSAPVFPGVSCATGDQQLFIEAVQHLGGKLDQRYVAQPRQDVRVDHFAVLAGCRRRLGSGSDRSSERCEPVFSCPTDSDGVRAPDKMTAAVYFGQELSQPLLGLLLWARSGDPNGPAELTPIAGKGSFPASTRSRYTPLPRSLRSSL